MKFRWFILIVLLCCLTGSVQAGWLTGWDYRQMVHINGSSSGDLTNYQMNLSVFNTSGSSLGSAVYLDDHTYDDILFSDLRITTDDGETLIPIWNETERADGWDIWMNVPSIPTTGTDVYVYYGNSEVSEVWDGKATFPLLFDHFDGVSVNSSLWTGDGISIANSIVTVRYAGVEDGMLFTLDTFGDNISVHTLMKTAHHQQDTYHEYFLNYGLNSSNSLVEYFSYTSPTYGIKFRTRSASGITYSTMDFWVADTYLKNQYIRNSSYSVDFWLNNTLDSVHTTYLPIGAGRMYFVARNAIGAVVSIDYIFVRQYHYPEPAPSTWTAEETAPCEASFTGTPLSGSTPLTVQFTDESTTGAGTLSYNWSFGDSTPNSTQQNPAHTYTTSGCYDVVLTVANTFNNSTLIREDYVCSGNVTPTPTPTITPTPTGTPPVQAEIPQGRINPFAFVVLTLINCGMIVFTFAENENRNYLYIVTAIGAMILSFLLAVFLLGGTVTQDFVIEQEAVTVNESVLSTYGVQHIAITDIGFGYFFVFQGIVMLIITVLAVTELFIKPQRGIGE